MAGFAVLAILQYGVTGLSVDPKLACTARPHRTLSAKLRILVLQAYFLDIRHALSTPQLWAKQARLYSQIVADFEAL